MFSLHLSFPLSHLLSLSRTPISSAIRYVTGLPTGWLTYKLSYSAGAGIKLLICNTKSNRINRISPSRKKVRKTKGISKQRHRGMMPHTFTSLETRWASIFSERYAEGESSCYFCSAAAATRSHLLRVWDDVYQRHYWRVVWLGLKVEQLLLVFRLHHCQSHYGITNHQPAICTCMHW